MTNETTSPTENAKASDQPIVHTPGPWDWHEDKFRGGRSGLFAEDGTPVCVPNCSNDGDSGAAWFEDMLTDEDARLIADAPAMLKALREMVDFAEVDERSKAAFDRAYDILEKHGG